MYRGTTPTVPITISGADLTLAKLFLTFQWGQTGEQLTLTTPDDFTVTFDSEHNKTVGEIELTQEQTLAMTAGDCVSQIRFVFPDGASGVTKKDKFTINDVLFKEVITYE